MPASFCEIDLAKLGPSTHLVLGLSLINLRNLNLIIGLKSQSVLKINHVIGLSNVERKGLLSKIGKIIFLFLCYCSSAVCTRKKLLEM